MRATSMGGAAALCCCLCFNLYASNETGTGEPTVALNLDTNERMVIYIEHEDKTYFGTAKLVQGYGNAILDLSENGTIKPQWGRAEISIHCPTADVIIYQTMGQTEQEFHIAQLALPGC